MLRLAYLVRVADDRGSARRQREYLAQRTLLYASHHFAGRADKRAAARRKSEEHALQYEYTGTCFVREGSTDRCSQWYDMYLHLLYAYTSSTYAYIAAYQVPGTAIAVKKQNYSTFERKYCRYYMYCCTTCTRSISGVYMYSYGGYFELRVRTYDTSA